jgi:ubiquinone/menaquinone biosynthesis C-methylase UbiE
MTSHITENQRHWDSVADRWVASGEREWRKETPTWGMWGVPDSEFTLFPQSLRDKDAIELGCGTGYVSAWMARRGARVVGIDNSEKQLATARRLAAEHGVSLTLIHGNAEAVPYPDASFDFAVSEYGAALWCDPYRWIPEAHRLLRRGGELSFLTQSTLLHLCSPPDGTNAGDRLMRPTFGMHVFDWSAVEHEPGGVEFNLATSEWMRLFRRTGFEVLDFIEVQAPPEATGTPYTVSAEWSKLHPSEQVWKLRKRA